MPLIKRAPSFHKSYSLQNLLIEIRNSANALTEAFNLIL